MEYQGIVIGIDPGVMGGFAVLDMKGEVLEAKSFPLIEIEKPNHRSGQKETRIERYYDREELIDDLNVFAPNNTNTSVRAYLELVHSMPRDGVASAFKFGDCFGQLKMAMTALDIPTVLLSPQRWTKHIHDSNLSKEMTAKKRSAQMFERLFTKFHSTFSKKVPDGIIDAVLIAEFGRQMLELGIDDYNTESSSDEEIKH